MKTNRTQAELNEINAKKVEKLNNALAVEAEMQEADLLVDFDKIIDEKSKKPLVIKFQEKLYQVPADMPFSFAMFFFRHCFKKKNGVQTISCPEDKLGTFIELMFGQSFLNALENAKNIKVGLNFVMEELSPKILREWGYDTTKSSHISKKKYS